MAGRHLIATKASLNTLNLAHARVALAATAAGSMFGVALPAGGATADHSGAEALADLSTTQVDQSAAPAATEAFTAATVDEESDVAADITLEDQASATDLNITVELPEEPEADVTEAAPAPAAAAPAAQAQAAPAAQAQTAAPVAQQAAPAAEQAAQAAAPAATQAASAPVAAGSSASAAVAIGRQYIGTPYRYAGATPAGFDCSGFVSYVYRQMGYSLPHSSSAIRNSGTIISAAAAQPGDIMWWPGHVAIYTGSGQLEAIGYGSPLRESPVRGGATYIRVAR